MSEQYDFDDLEDYYLEEWDIIVSDSWEEYLSRYS